MTVMQKQKYKTTRQDLVFIVELHSGFTPYPYPFLVRASAWLNMWSCLSACPFQLALESLCDIVAKQRSDYPSCVIFFEILYVCNA